MGVAKANARNDGAKGAKDDLLAVLPDNRAWYTKSHLIKLHFCIGSLVLFCRSPSPIFNGSRTLTYIQHPPTDTMVVS